MKRVKIAELRDHLSRYLDHVRAGGTLLVLDRDRPIAEIRPVAVETGSRARGDDARLAELERKGIGRRGTGRLSPRFFEELKKSRPLAPGTRLLEALLEEREESR